MAEQLVADRTGVRALSTKHKGGGVALKPEHIADNQPEFAMLPKKELHIDHSYQRHMSTERVKTIAREWSWIACGALKVALREDGEWYVFDGQHRQAASLLRVDITVLPCLIYEVRDIITEAKGFLSQTSARPMNRTDRFKAAIIAGDPTALIIQELTQASGYVVRVGARVGDRAVSCIGSIESCVKVDEGATRRLWPLLIKLTENDMLTKELMMGFFYLETHIDCSLTDKRWLTRILQIGPNTFKKSIVAAIAFRKSGTPKVYAEGILAAINTNLRNRLKSDTL